MKNNRIHLSLLSLLAIAGMIACEDVFEEDLSGKKVALMAPSDQGETGNMTQTFLWGELEGVDHYNLQVVSPSYSNIEKLVLDTNITSRLFEYTLFEGNFEWRVAAINFSSIAYSDTFALKVVNTGEIDEVTLVLPAENTVTNDDEITFKWSFHPNVDEYILLVRKDSWESGPEAYTDTLTGISNKIVMDEGDYFWGVIGMNDSSISQQVNYRALTVDRTPPLSPFNPTPVNEDTVTISNQSVTLLWSRDSNDDVVKDSIYVYTDSGMSALKAKASCTDASYKLENVADATFYYWRVRSFDRAGNASDFNSLWKFRTNYE